jgi:hypothetical protein
MTKAKGQVNHNSSRNDRYANGHESDFWQPFPASLLAPLEFCLLTSVSFGSASTQYVFPSSLMLNQTVHLPVFPIRYINLAEKENRNASLPDANSTFRSVSGMPIAYGDMSSEKKQQGTETSIIPQLQ